MPGNAKKLFGHELDITLAIVDQLSAGPIALLMSAPPRLLIATMASAATPCGGCRFAWWAFAEGDDWLTVVASSAVASVAVLTAVGPVHAWAFA